MNIILNRFSFRYLKETSLHLIKELKVTKAYCINAYAGNITEEDLKRFAIEGCEIIQFDAFDVFEAQYVEADWNQIEPLDSVLLKQMAPVESVLMRIMERFGHEITWYNSDLFDPEFVSQRNYLIPYKFLHGEVLPIAFEEKKRKYFRHLRFWSDFLKKNRIDAAFFTTNPHYSYEVVLYHLMESHKTPVVICSYLSAPFYERSVFYFDYRKYNPLIGERYQEYIKQDTSKIEFGEDFKAHWKMLTSKDPNDKIPVYMKPGFYDSLDFKEIKEDHEINLKKRKVKIDRTLSQKIKLALRVMFDLDFWHYKLIVRSSAELDKRYRKFYDTLVDEVKWDAKYLYFPLHYQPEESSAPRGGYFASQELMLEMITYLIPSDWLVYIKEHPYQGRGHRSHEFYLDLKKNPKVRILGRGVDTFTLIKQSRGVVTISGAAGWEAIFENKPVLLFGSNFFQYAPGVFRINDLDDCKKAIEMIVNGVNIPQSALKAFVKAVEDFTYKGSMYESGLTFNKLSYAENARELGRGFIETYLNRKS